MTNLTSVLDWLARAYQCRSCRYRAHWIEVRGRSAFHSVHPASPCILPPGFTRTAELCSLFLHRETSICRVASQLTGVRAV